MFLFSFVFIIALGAFFAPCATAFSTHNSIANQEAQWSTAVGVGPVTALAVAANGERIAAVVDDTLVVVVDARTGHTVHTYTTNEQERVRAIGLSPDGSTVYSITAQWCWQPEVTCTALFSYRNVETGERDGLILWAFDNTEYTYTIPSGSALSVAPDGKTVVVGTGWHYGDRWHSVTSGELFYYNTERRAFDSLKPPTDRRIGNVLALDVSADGTHCFAAISQLDDTPGSPYIKEEGYVAFAVPGREREYSAAGKQNTLMARFSPNGYYVLTGDALLDYAHHTDVYTEKPWNALDAQWLGNGAHAVVWERGGTSSVISLYNLFTRIHEGTFPIEKDIKVFAMNKGASAFFVGSDNGVLERWDIPGTLHRPVLVADFQIADTVVQLLDTVYFHNTSYPLTPATIHYWDFGDGTTSMDTYARHAYTKPGVYTVSLRVGNEYSEQADKIKSGYIVVPPLSGDIAWIDKTTDRNVASVVFSPDGNFIAAAHGSTTVAVQRAETGQAAEMYTLPKGNAARVAFSPDGSHLYCIAATTRYRPSRYDKYMQALDVDWYVYDITRTTGTVRELYHTTGEDLLSGEIRNSDTSVGVVAIVAVPPVGNTVYWCLGYHVYGYPGIRHWGWYLFRYDTRAEQLWQIGRSPFYANSAHPLQSMLVTSDGTELLTASDSGGTIVLRDAVTGGEKQRLQDSAAYVRFSQDGTGILSGGALWQRENGTFIRRNGIPDSLLFEVFPYGDAVALALPSKDTAMAVYSIPRDSVLYRFGATPSAISSIAISPDGRLVCTGGQTGHVALWRMPKGVVVRGANNGDDAVQLHIAPNPVSDDIELEIELREGGNARIEVVDLTGKPIAERELLCKKQQRQKVVLSVRHAEEGMYLCRVQTPLGQRVRLVLLVR